MVAAQRNLGSRALNVCTHLFFFMEFSFPPVELKQSEILQGIRRHTLPEKYYIELGNYTGKDGNHRKWGLI